MLDNLAIGFAAVLHLEHVSLLGLDLYLPIYILYCFLGVFIGTMIGVLPGLGPVSTIAMLLPATYALPPLAGLIMLSGIYYGAMYGGSTTAILISLPGEVASAVTCIEGNMMARQGRAGVALAMSAIGSFVAGCFGVLVLAAFAPMLAEVAFAFGAAEYFSLMVLGIVCAVVLANGPVMKSLSMVCVGLLLGMVGADINSGTPRYTFGFLALFDGFNIVAIAMGIFGLGEIIANLTRGSAQYVSVAPINRLFPNREDVRRSVAPILRGTALGSVIGLLPGGGAVISAFGSYALEKRLSKHGDFGKGAIEGLAGPESANNAAAQTAFIPLLTLGLPGNSVMALILGAMMIHNIQPGPQVMSSQPSLWWGLVVSMWVGNLMLLILNLPLVGIWVRLLSVPYKVLYPAILAFCCIGVYAMNYSVADVYAMVAFGFLGYIFVKLGCEPAPLLLGFVLGPLMEENLRRALLLARGDLMVFLEKPISLALLASALVLLASVIIPKIRATRVEAFREE